MRQIILSLLLLTTVFGYSQTANKTTAVRDSSAVGEAVYAPEVKSADVGLLARAAYDKTDYKASINLLETEMKKQKALGNESAELYYNLGNAYYRLNEMGKARLYYERALLIDPSDKDTRHNIDFVKTKIEDKIVVADTFFISIWMTSIQNWMTSNAWANFAIVSFILLIACLFGFFFTQKVVVKQATFYVGLILVILCVFANVFSYHQKQSVEIRNTAVVMTGAASVHSSPDRNSKDVFTLHEGTKINIVKEDRSWLEIEIADGSVGWIQREKIEII